MEATSHANFKAPSETNGTRTPTRGSVPKPTAPLGIALCGSGRSPPPILVDVRRLGRQQAQQNIELNEPRFGAAGMYRFVVLVPPLVPRTQSKYSQWDTYKVLKLCYLLPTFQSAQPHPTTSPQHPPFSHPTAPTPTPHLHTTFPPRPAPHTEASKLASA